MSKISMSGYTAADKMGWKFWLLHLLALCDLQQVILSLLALSAWHYNDGNLSGCLGKMYTKTRAMPGT